MTVSTTVRNVFASANVHSSTRSHDSQTNNVASPSISAGAPVAQSAGDEQLAREYGKQLVTGGRVRVPVQSTMGRWLLLLQSIIDSPVFKRMEALQGSAPAEVVIDAQKGDVAIRFIGKINDENISLVDVPGGKEIIDALMAAAKALAPNTRLSIPSFYQDGTVPLSAVQAFYGESEHLTPAQAAARSRELAKTPIFKGQGALQDSHSLEEALRAVGDCTTLYNILAVLRQKIENPGSALDLDTSHVEIAPHSTLWEAQKNPPMRMSVGQLIAGYGWKVPGNQEELRSLERALSVSPLREHDEGNYGGLLTKDVQLSAEHHAQLNKVVEAWKKRQQGPQTKGQGTPPNLLEYLSQSLPEPLRTRPIKEPGDFLKVLISSVEGQALGKQIQEAIGALPTPTSAQEALLSALLLDADPAAGQQRNNLAGYNLRQTDNWGHSPSEIAQRFEKHLEGRYGAQLAKVVAYQLLSVSSPEFVVKDIPPDLVYGSRQWASLSAAVSRIEQDTPGASATMTYSAIMAHDEIAPITDLSERQMQFAQMKSAIDWGIANGVIEQKNDDAYTAEEVDRSVSAVNDQVDELADAVEGLTAPMPTRRDLALDELRRVYGVENEAFFEQKLLGESLPGSPGRKNYSLLDIYMSGDLGKHMWFSSDPAFSTTKVGVGFSKLLNAKKNFDEKFEAYVENLKKSLNVLFKYQVSLLPLEDRRLLEGKVTTFMLEPPSGQDGVGGEHEIFKYTQSNAILIRAERDGKNRHYLYSPAQGRIIGDAGPTTQSGLQFPTEELYFTLPCKGGSGENQEPVTIKWQTLNGRSPNRAPSKFNALSIYPSKSLEWVPDGPLPEPRLGAPSAKVDELATVVAAYYSRGLDEAKVAANGQTEQEREDQLSRSVHQFFLELIPFYSAVKRFVDGKLTEGFFHLVLDIFGFVVPGLKGGIQAVKAGATRLGTALQFVKGFAKAGVKAVNPLAQVYDIGRGVFKLGGYGIKRLSTAKGPLLGKLRNFRARSGSFSPARAGGKDSIAEGVYRPSAPDATPVPTVAVQRNGKWYAFDVKTNQPYGAPLKGFTPKASSAIGRQVLSTATDTTLNATFSAATSLVQQKITDNSMPRPLNPEFTQSGLTPQEQEPGAVDGDPGTQSLEPGLSRRIEAAKVSVAMADKRSLELESEGLPGGDVPSKIWSNDPVELMDQIESTLDDIEERTRTAADVHEVFFKPYFSTQPVSQSSYGMASRLDTIEKRIAAIRKAQALLSAKSEPAAA